jgi:acyl CoA:acetate/3-ketoacid CoA transferase alpha subunit
MANRYAAGAAGLPCALMRGYILTDPESRTRVARLRAGGFALA